MYKKRLKYVVMLYIRLVFSFYQLQVVLFKLNFPFYQILFKMLTSLLPIFIFSSFILFSINLSTGSKPRMWKLSY
jgi:hypothetical protein